MTKKLSEKELEQLNTIVKDCTAKLYSKLNELIEDLVQQKSRTINLYMSGIIKEVVTSFTSAIIVLLHEYLNDDKEEILTNVLELIEMKIKGIEN